jgi:3-isopropylmalate/(R)-2-methylmalate dehydratase small subunit
VQPFKTHTGIVAPLDRANVDTDQIIAKQFLKSIKRTGFGKDLFNDWRYDADGLPRPDFSLNQLSFEGASILVARNNFGCGSSREHAVWAVMQFGIKVVIAPWAIQNGERIPGFADIFRNNSEKNGLLPIQLSEEEVDQIFALVEADPGSKATVDLEAQTVTVHGPTDVVFAFDIDDGVKASLLAGMDEIAQTLQYTDDIESFETTHNTQLPAGA